MTQLAANTDLINRAIAPIVESATSTLKSLDAPDPTWAVLRGAVQRIGESIGEWGGVPVPVDHVRLVMEPRYPMPRLTGFKLPRAEDRAPTESQDFEVINSWHCFRRGLRVFVCRESNGKSTACFLSDGSGARLTYWMNTLGVAAGHVWDPNTETRALEKLRSLVSAHAFNCYQLAGGFLETSPRSGVQYVFRKLRPTIALRPGSDGNVRVIAVLCMHPLGYYEESWAGVMCPTDDVIAHLVLMRGDEHRFWKKANHHEQSAASAGI
jgi:hypothetical protein